MSVQSQLLAHLTFSCAFVGVEWFNPVYWTLAIEMQFYILLAILMPVARLSTIHLICIAFALMPCLELGEQFIFHYGAMFNFGIVLCLFYKQQVSLAQTIFYLSLSAAIVSLYNGWVQTFACVLAGCLFVVGLKSPGWLQNRYTVGIGVISYSLYLVHVPVGGRIINLAEKLTVHRELRYLAIALAVAVVIAFSALFWRYIERPTMSWKRKAADLPSHS